MPQFMIQNNVPYFLFNGYNYRVKQVSLFEKEKNKKG